MENNVHCAFPCPNVTLNTLNCRPSCQQPYENQVVWNVVPDSSLIPVFEYGSYVPSTVCLDTNEIQTGNNKYLLTQNEPSCSQCVFVLADLEHNNSLPEIHNRNKYIGKFSTNSDSKANTQLPIELVNDGKSEHENEAIDELQNGDLIEKALLGNSLDSLCTEEELFKCFESEEQSEKIALHLEEIESILGDDKKEENDFIQTLNDIESIFGH